MSEAWLPGAGRMRVAADGGPLKGGAPRVVWQAIGADPRTVSAGTAAHRLARLGRASHLVWNPLQGEVVQLIPILRAGRSLGSAECLEQSGPPPLEQAPGAVGPAWDDAGAAEVAEVGTEGRLCVQICVVAFPWEPFTDGPVSGLRQILDWLDTWGIPRRWPAGRPVPFPLGRAACRSRRLWARGGHFGASQVPGLTAAGPGAVDIDVLTGLNRRSGRSEPAVAVPELGALLRENPGADARLAEVARVG